MTTPAEVVTAARRITLAANYGFFTTTAGGIQTRLVQHLDVSDGCRITFGTGPHTRKAASVGADPKVSYAAYDPETGAAATIYGDARLVDDLDRRTELWVDSLAPFFPDGPASGGFVLVTIDPRRIEVWSMPDGLAPAPFGLSSCSTEQTGGTWLDVVGTHPATHR